MKAESLMRLQKLVDLLSDGSFHSGEYLATCLGVSRTAIWKLVNKLKAWQIEVYSVRGKGYKIPGGLSLLDREYLTNEIKQKATLFSEIDVLSTVDSTSSYLTRRWQQKIGVGCICVSEHQTKGRGRNGRKWISPFGANLYFSLGLSFPLGLSGLGGLSLAVGIGLTKLLNQHTVEKVSLKWPNDLLVNGSKLAGILVEVSGDSKTSSFLNIGIGINWNMTSNQNITSNRNISNSTHEIDQPWCNLSSILNNDISRTEILAIVLLELDAILVKYIEQGFDPFRSEWAEQSAFYGKQIFIHTQGSKISGIEAGIDKSGAIRIQTDEGEKSFYSGEVSLRGSLRNRNAR